MRAKKKIFFANCTRSEYLKKKCVFSSVWFQLTCDVVENCLDAVLATEIDSRENIFTQKSIQPTTKCDSTKLNERQWKNSRVHFTCARACYASTSIANLHTEIRYFSDDLWLTRRLWWTWRMSWSYRWCCVNHIRSISRVFVRKFEIRKLMNSTDTSNLKLNVNQKMRQIGKNLWEYLKKL